MTQTNNALKESDMDTAELTQEWADNLAKLTRQTSEFMQTYADVLAKKNEDLSEAESGFMSAMRSYSKMLASLSTHPEELIENQMELYQEYTILWANTMARLMGEDIDPYDVAPQKDRRFKDEAWSKYIAFDFVKQAYFITSGWMQEIVDDLDDVDEKTKRKLHFYTRQWIEALSPTNFATMNPEVLRETMESNGENLVRGMENLMHDLQSSKEKLDIAMTARDAFEVGKTLAFTPGKVVFKNALVEILQYTPTTEKVHKTPLFIVSPWINKYYILDLQAHNSMVKWLVDQGHTVFITSWVNPDASLARTRFEDYFLKAVLPALEAIETLTGEKRTNLVGYCIGGTLMAAGLSYLEQKGESDRIASITFFTTLTDFEDPGELSVFIDDEQVEALSRRLKTEGVYEGEDMSFIFRSLRASDLIWSFVVNNYLLGKTPFPFDLLYWNQDTTALPADMHLFYLRKLYLANALATPRKLQFDGVKLALSDIDIPTYMLSTKEDHIAPWKSTYKLTQQAKGPMRFVLSASGHVAGVVNPPRPDLGKRHKYGYWVMDKTPKQYPADPDAWLEQAEQHQHSWWRDWDQWLAEYSDGKVDAKPRTPASSLPDAPGEYVKVRR